MPERFDTLPCRDALQRPLHDLRISVTDRCNLRCAYCMPREVFGRDFVFLHHDALLRFEEILRLARQCVALGVRKIRLSGGEPLLRRGIERLVEMLATLTTLEARPLEVAMTTNGTLLAKKARDLKNAGLARLNISLDALDEAVFQRATGGNAPLAAVLEGIAAAQAAGLAPIKINVVVKRGINEDHILPLAARFRHSGIIVRFIEFMDAGTRTGWRLDDVVAARDILATLHARYPLRALDAQYPGEVAKRWQYTDGAGEIGVIASVTQAFCHECSRLRLSTDGKLYTCLFASEGADLRAPLRAGEDDEALRNRIAAIWHARSGRYSQLRHAMRAAPTGRIEMSYIGG
ncbi:MAG: GTP 3',8-cyclase MoaA [Azoarcus sp.]|jgi:cyclic pyranopterin phosphate synthase|nr:GTP 3',8-cyclase MoaA [Azoarcus sp.]